MDKQREMFEVWFDTTFAGVPMSHMEETVAWQAWQAAQKVQWQPIGIIQKESVLSLLKGYDQDNKEYVYSVVVWKDGEWLLSESLSRPCFAYTEWSNCLSGLPTQ